MSAAPTRLFLVRHGATTLTHEDRFAGSTDVPLSEEGRAQAERLAARLAKDPIAAVYASPLARARATAEVLARPHGRQVVILPELREISHGRWETLTRAEVEALHPEEYRRWEADPYTFAPLGGETGLEVTSRALPALLGLVERHPGKHVLVVSHKATIRLLLSSLLGFDPRRYRDRLDMAPAALNVLDFRDPTRARLTLYNDVSHHSAPLPETPHHRLSKWWDGEK